MKVKEGQIEAEEIPKGTRMGVVAMENAYSICLGNLFPFLLHCDNINNNNNNNNNTHTHTHTNTNTNTHVLSV
jgi:hypothetical protein